MTESLEQPSPLRSVLSQEELHRLIGGTPVVGYIDALREQLEFEKQCNVAQEKGTAALQEQLATAENSLKAVMQDLGESIEKLLIDLEQAQARIEKLEGIIANMLADDDHRCDDPTCSSWQARQTLTEVK